MDDEYEKDNWVSVWDALLSAMKTWEVMVDEDEDHADHR